MSGTSAPTPSFAGIVALIVQSTGARQGQANYQLYRLAAGESLAACNASNTSALPAASCIFNDVTSGNDAVPGEAGYGTSSADYSATVGYDLATGLGSLNVRNLVFGWNGGSTAGAAASGTQVSLWIDSPASNNSTVIGQTTFYGWALANNSQIVSVNIAIDSVPYGAATYGVTRTDVCAVYTSSSCPGVGWSFPFNTTLLADGAHTFAATAQAANGQVYTTSTTFSVANWTSSNPMLTVIDSPSANSPAFSGIASFGGWAIDSLSAIAQVAVSVDGVSYGLAQYGVNRPDVCAVHPNYAGCPNVGWSLLLDTTRLSDGPHTLAVTPVTTGGQHATTVAAFTVSNTPANVITLSVDQPNTQSAPFSGFSGFGGWALGTSQPINTIAVTIDGVSYGNAIYGAARPDVCSVFPDRPSCPNVGWNFAFDTAQLPNGLHILGLKALTAAGQYVSTTRNFTVANPSSASPVLVYVDSPSPQNSIVFGTAGFRGWAISNASVSNVAIAVDGVPYGTATYGAARPDVCAAYANVANCPNVGWTFPLDTTQLADGLHTMTATATVPESAGTFVGTVSSAFTVVNWSTSNPMKLNFDSPNAQSGPLSGSVTIGGWVIDTQAAINQVSVAVDGIPLGNANSGIARNDVCAVFSNSIGCPNVGWNYRLNTTLFPDGTHTLAVTAATSGGQNSTFSTTFTTANGSSTPIHISIDTPNSSETLAGISPIGGWAVDSSGAVIASVEILVDGDPVGTAIYGGARADVCAQFNTAGGCPNVGWNYELNTAGFANGGHTLGVRATGSDGQQYTVSTGFNIGNQP